MRKGRLSKERKRVESEIIVLVVWYKRKWNRKLEEKKDLHLVVDIKPLNKNNMLAYINNCLQFTKKLK